LGFQPSIPPFSEAKMKAAGPEWPLASCTTKSFGFVSLLNTWPVGAPEVIVTTRLDLLTVVAVAEGYRVVLSLPLSDTHRDPPGAWSVPGEAETPQEFTRSGSGAAVRPGISETRFTAAAP
jgi:hypothetical protein